MVVWVATATHENDCGCICTAVALTEEAAKQTLIMEIQADEHSEVRDWKFYKVFATDVVGTNI